VNDDVKTKKDSEKEFRAKKHSLHHCSISPIETEPEREICSPIQGDFNS
jgi:hypothetical protein